jgi:hypothetical protein
MAGVRRPADVVVRDGVGDDHAGRDGLAAPGAPRREHRQMMRGKGGEGKNRQSDTAAHRDPGSLTSSASRTGSLLLVLVGRDVVTFVGVDRAIGLKFVFAEWVPLVVRISTEELSKPLTKVFIRNSVQAPYTEMPHLL